MIKLYGGVRAYSIPVNSNDINIRDLYTSQKTIILKGEKRNEKLFKNILPNKDRELNGKILIELTSFFIGEIKKLTNYRNNLIVDHMKFLNTIQANSSINGVPIFNNKESALYYIYYISFYTKLIIQMSKDKDFYNLNIKKYTKEIKSFTDNVKNIYKMVSKMIDFDLNLPNEAVDMIYNNISEINKIAIKLKSI